MANFDTGVQRYIRTYAVVEVAFPVDWHGREEIACKHCKFYIKANQRCGLTQEIVNYPERYVGECCPLQEIEGTENEHND